MPAADTPAPVHYRIPSAFDSTRIDLSKGKTFGIGRKYYENVYTPNQTNVAPRVSAQVPAPNRYSPLEANPLGKNAKKFLLKSRVPPCTSSTRDFPAPTAYKPVHILTEASRYSGIGFGVGNRGKVTGTASKI